jgi:hypothetical protein
VRDYPDFDKIDTINIAPEIVDLMNIYSRLREMDKGDILIEHLELLLAMSTHMRNRDAKISRAPNGKTMSAGSASTRFKIKFGIFYEVAI